MNRMIEPIRKPALTFVEIVVGLYLIALAFLSGMLAEKIDLEKDRDAVHRYDEALRQWHAQVIGIEKTARYLQSTQDLDPTVRQNNIGASAEKSQ